MICKVYTDAGGVRSIIHLLRRHRLVIYFTKAIIVRIFVSFLCDTLTSSMLNITFL